MPKQRQPVELLTGILRHLDRPVQGPPLSRHSRTRSRSGRAGANGIPTLPTRPSARFTSPAHFPFNIPINTTDTTGTSLAIVSPYLAHGIEVRNKNTGSRIGGRLLSAGITRRKPHMPWLEYGQIEGREYSEMLRDLLPVLRPFEQIDKELPDGTVPAIELAKILIGGADDEYNYKVSKSEHDSGIFVLADIDDEEVYQLQLRPDWDWWLSDYLATANHEEITVRHPAEAIDYLRSKHFAVGLEAHQFIEKK